MPGMQGTGLEGVATAEQQSAEPPGGRCSYPKLECAEPPLSELEFYGCYSRPMTLAEYEDYEGRIEFFDSRAGIACLACEAAHFPHEDPLHTLARILERIAEMRGSPIVCRGAAEIRRTLPASGDTRRIQPDQMVFLDTERRRRIVSGYLKAGEDPYPDVVVEVDSTTDVRGNRLKLYEAWGFPEVWVEVPDAYAPSRPRGLRSGLRIHLLEGGQYVLAEASRAFPGWRAAEIHQALNEPAVSAKTSAVLSRVGRVLGERDGTGPEDDPLLRVQRAESRVEGRAEGTAKALLRHREIAVPPDFPAGLARRDLDALHAASEEQVFSAASAATSFADFLARLARLKGPDR